jgi:hypothetical protein
MTRPTDKSHLPHCNNFRNLGNVWKSSNFMKNFVIHSCFGGDQEVSLFANTENVTINGHKKLHRALSVKLQ